MLQVQYAYFLPLFYFLKVKYSQFCYKPILKMRINMIDTLGNNLSMTIQYLFMHDSQ